MESKYCDIVMKGGITSGVVYPLTIVELAEEYRFKNIGGTSAGAIAAVLTAAAEYGRRNGKPNAFSTVQELPTELSQDNFLLNLFQPTPAASKIFKVFLFCLKYQSPWARGLAAVAGLIGQFWLAMLAGALVGSAFPVALYFRCHGPIGPYILLGILWALIGTIVGMLVSATRTLLGALGRGGFGMCTGLPTSRRPALTEWLHNKIQQAANLASAPKPLTFGDLWTAQKDADEPLTSGRVINLETVTTNLTQGRPFTLPFQTHEFYFDRDEFLDLFPSDIVNWLVANAEPSRHHPNRTVKSEAGATLVHLPAPENMPILLAARMSLSFPILLRAVPLYAVDFTLAKNQADTDGAPLVADRCWFSDGGICSNFPMQFFDSPLPRWPTFGINLKSPHPDHDKEEDMVWLPTKPGSGSQVAWNKFDDGSNAHRIAGFFGAIINTMQNWRDNLQSVSPGYRDRIVHISLRDDEGGLNLNMPPELIKKLSLRGKRAGEFLKTKFNFGNHIWARYRLTMCSLQGYLGSLTNAWVQSIPQQKEGKDYINSVTPPPEYAGSPGTPAQLKNALDQLVRTSQNWIGDACDEAPNPHADLRGQPKF